MAEQCVRNTIGFFIVVWVWVMKLVKATQIRGKAITCEAQDTFGCIKLKKRRQAALVRFCGSARVMQVSTSLDARLLHCRDVVHSHPCPPRCLRPYDRYMPVPSLRQSSRTYPVVLAPLLRLRTMFYSLHLPRPWSHLKLLRPFLITSGSQASLRS